MSAKRNLIIVASRIGFVLCLIGLTCFLTACEEKATVAQMSEVKDKVDTVERSLQRNKVKVSALQSEVREDLRRIEYRQAQTEAAFVQMGKGFNSLSESVEETYTKAQALELGQIQLAQSIDQPQIQTIIQGAPVWQDTGGNLNLVGRNLRSAMPVARYRILEDFKSIESTSDQGTVEVFEVFSVAQNLYIMGSNGQATTCIRLLQWEAGVGNAELCDDPFTIYDLTSGN